MTSSLETTDNESKAVAVAPRVSLADINDAINGVFYTTGYSLAVHAADITLASKSGVYESLEPLTICLIVMKNGFSVIGKAAPASPENFNVELGRKFAYEDAVRQIWPLMGFALKDRVHRG